MKQIADIIAQTLSLELSQVNNTIYLLDDGATIPFISRYRKELTGNLDEVKVAAISEHYDKLKELEKRRETILNTIREQEKLTPELEEKIKNCFSSTELEDIYLPYKPRRRTKAQIAREKGLEGLAKIIMKQQVDDPEYSARRFLNDEVKTTDEAIEGAQHIIAEWISEHETARNIVRRSFEKAAVMTAKVIKGKEEEGDNYRDYFEFSESLKRISSHRLLAIRRAEKEGVLRVSISPEKASPLHHLERFFVKGNTASSDLVYQAMEDAYKRLIKPSIETEFAALSKEKADKDAINIFANNLRQLLLAPPLGQKRILAIDPGFRTGCKVVCLDEQGNLLHNETIYPHPPQSQTGLAMKKLSSLVEMFKIEAISIGNGTASRETESFIQRIRFDRELKVFVISEAGASVYSASKLARDEFPEYDVTVRGAISIGRRLMDPLAELVKIEPKAIGVGQYQHDVDQNELKKSLDMVVESCVNHVGVNLNTASKHLLSYVSGLGPKVAESVTDFRKDNGVFKTREDIKKVPGLGDKTFTQCAGFLRIPDAVNPLDNSAVHPESYHIVTAMARTLKKEEKDLIADKTLLGGLQPEQFVTGSIGIPTISDIIKELEKPGRDPRKQIKVFEFDQNIRKITDLKPGMVLPGIISNVTKFGAFVDIGIKENGLVHISELADKFVSDPTTEVSLHQQVFVRVLSIDHDRKRIALSMKNVKQ
ncbi:Tex family protein [Saccharicrinis sp. FJH62]|uniref:Tex family protein n=1 Tax=Saccharicrinis sp. FJH62 TaxID=3344657 RepID=UPI0035D3ED24